MSYSSQCPTSAQKTQIRDLCRKVFTAAGDRGGLNLLELGLSAEVLTPEVLLADMDRPGRMGRMSLLQFLTDNGCLPQIPVQCLPPAVTLKNRFYPTRDNEVYFSNFVDYCAGEGHYRYLPENYQTRDYLLGKVVAESEWALCPLKRAALLGHLSTLPLDRLQPTDLSDLVVQHACLYRQIGQIAHLILPEHITPHTLIYHCFSKGYLPKTIVKNLTSRVLLEPVEGGCALYQAILYGLVDAVPTIIFVHEFKAAKEATLGAIERLESNCGISRASADARILVAKTWLAQVGKEILGMKAAKITANKVCSARPLD